MHNVLHFAMLTLQPFGNNISLTGGGAMSFQLRQDKKETENKTIRFPLTLIEEIERAIKGKNVSFSSFVIQACEYALKDMDREKSK